MNLGNLLVLVLAAVGAALVALTLASVAGRMIVLSRGRQRRRAELRARPELLALLDGEAPPASADRGQRRAAERLALQMLTKVRGDARGPLVAFLEREGVLARARRRVRSRGVVRRARAVGLLGVAGSADDVPALVDRLADRRPEVRVVAARALGKIGDERAAAALVGALSGQRPVPLGIGQSALVALGPPALPSLRGGLRSPDDDTREAIAEVLGLLGDAASAPQLVDALVQDPVASVRVAAARALGRMASPQATPSLLAALAAETAPPLRVAAAAALAQAGVGGAPAALVAALGDPVAEVGRHAATALAASGEEGARALRGVVGAGGPAGAHAREALARLELVAQARGGIAADSALARAG